MSTVRKTKGWKKQIMEGKGRKERLRHEARTQIRGWI